MVQVEQSATDFVCDSTWSSCPTLFLFLPYNLRVQHCYYFGNSFFEGCQLIDFDFYIQGQVFDVDFEGSVFVGEGDGCFG
jgi:hypothetical protein